MGQQANRSRPPRPRARRRERILVRLNFAAYPVQASLGALGRKWALLVLMNIALSKARRFNELLRSNPGMSKRILALRLNDLEHNGFLSRAVQGPGHVEWQLTQKGADVLPVLLTLIHFGSKWKPDGDPGASPRQEIDREFEIAYTGRTREGEGGSSIP